MNRANSLAFYELLGNANLMNTELDRYHGVTAEDIKQECINIFKESGCSTLHYLAKN